MGGKALQGLAETKPIASFKDWDFLRAEVQRILTTNPGGTSPNAYYQKIRKFGSVYHATPILQGPKIGHSDVDFIVREDFIHTFKGEFDKTIAGLIGSKAFVRNGDVLSCEYKGHQIDFISSPGANVTLNLCLRGHGGAGAFLVDLLRPYGVSINRNGAFVRVMHDGEFVADLKRTDDFYLMLNMAALDQYAHSGSFTYGFKQLEDAYKFVFGSPQFTLRAFGLDADLNYVGDAKRLEYPPYAGFIKYIQFAAKTTSKPVDPTDAQIKYVKSRLTGSAYGGGKTFETQVKTAIQAFLSDKVLRKRFNGEIVMSITGLKPGQSLGKFMEAYRATYGTKDKFMYGIMSNSPETTEASIKGFFSEWIVKNPVLEEFEPDFLEGDDAPAEEVVPIVVETSAPPVPPKPIEVKPSQSSKLSKPELPPLIVVKRNEREIPELVKVSR